MSKNRGPQKVKLGESEYTVVAQRHGYLRSRLGNVVEELGQLNVEGSDIMGVIGEQAYVLLSVFIPDLMPEYEFQGYADQASYLEKHYLPEKDRSPSYDEIVGAFEVVMEVNRLDLLKHLKNLVGPDLIREKMNEALSPTTSSPS